MAPPPSTSIFLMLYWLYWCYTGYSGGYTADTSVILVLLLVMLVILAFYWSCLSHRGQPYQRWFVESEVSL